VKKLHPIQQILSYSFKTNQWQYSAVICVSKPKSASFSSESPRLEIRGGQKALFGRLLGDPTNYKAKDIEKITNLFCIYLLQIDKFINT
jgi:hypothetical protein